MTYAAEQHAHTYPVHSADWFARDSLHRANFAVMRDVVALGPKRVLDWGCGNALWSIGLFPGAHITGVDLSPECLRYAAMNARYNGCEFSTQLDGQYDAACSFALIELLPPESFDAIFHTIRQALKPGAPLYVTWHNWRALSVLYAGWLRKGGYEAYCSQLGHRISRKNMGAVLTDFRRLGYRVVRSGGYNPYPSRMWKTMEPGPRYRTENPLLAHFFCTQYAALVR